MMGPVLDSSGHWLSGWCFAGHGDRGLQRNLFPKRSQPSHL